MTPVNQIRRDRYLHVTGQCRHLPVMMRLVLDEDHLHELLSAVVNSRLRIQITQVQMSHIPSLQVAGPTDNPGGPGGPASTGRPPLGSPTGKPPAAMPLRTPRPGMLPGIPGARPGPIPGGAPVPGVGQPTQPNTEEETALVEVTIYGLSSLYERYPPRGEGWPGRSRDPWHSGHPRGGTGSREAGGPGLTGDHACWPGPYYPCTAPAVSPAASSFLLLPR